MKKTLASMAILAGGLALTANAGQLFVGTSSSSVSEEFLASGGTVNFTNSYIPQVNVPSGVQLKLTLSAGKFTAGSGATIALCGSTATPLATGNVAAGGQTATLIVTTALTATGVYTIQSGTTCGNNYIKYNLANLQAGTNVTLSIEPISGTPIPAAAAASSPVVSVNKQFTATVDKTTAKINTADIKKFISDNNFVNTSTVFAKFRINSDNTIISRLTVTNGSNCQGVLLAAFSVVFTVKGKLNEYTQIKVNKGTATTVHTHNITPANKAANQATFTVIPTGTNGIVCEGAPSSSYNTIALQVDGNTPIQADTKTTAIDLKIGSKTFNLIPDTPSHEIKLEATELYIPLVGVNPSTGRETYIKLQASNETLSSINVKFLILASDGSITAELNKTLTPGQPLTVTGTDLKQAATSAGKSIGDSFAVKVLVIAPQKDIFAYANIVDPTGAKRVPVKVVGGNIVE